MSSGLPLTTRSALGSGEADHAGPARKSIDITEIFGEYGGFVWRALRHLGVRAADLADVTQEVFLVAHRKLPEFEGRSSLRTWLYGICLRTASDYRRKAHIRREVAVDELPDQVAEPEQEVDAERVRLRARLEALLAELDEDKRAVFVLYEIEELSMKDIATLIGVPLQTAYSRLHAARRLLAQSLEDRR
ncbi:MAG: sigma-70 family RNA polymerase sigma factor [Polyangiaceae bacterium]